MSRKLDITEHTCHPTIPRKLRQEVYKESGEEERERAEEWREGERESGVREQRISLSLSRLTGCHLYNGTVKHVCC